MEEEIDDIVGDVRYTDSQRSVAASLVEYTCSATDTASASYGHDTYTVDAADSDSDSDPAPPRPAYYLQPALARTAVLHETYTQTSKTIIQLAETDGLQRRDVTLLDTQTSTISITENKSIQYRIQYCSSYPDSKYLERPVEAPYRPAFDATRSSATPTLAANTSQDHSRPPKDPPCNSYSNSKYLERPVEAPYRHAREAPRVSEPPSVDNSDENAEDQMPQMSLDDDSSKDRIHDTDTDKTQDSSNEEVLRVVEPQARRPSRTSISSSDKFNSDVEKAATEKHHVDSLDSESDMSDVPDSVDNDVEELYTKLSSSIINVRDVDQPDEIAIRKCATLTPLTEESTRRGASSAGDVQNSVAPTSRQPHLKSEDFQNYNGLNVKILADEQSNSKESFKLPPIRNPSCPGSPHLSLLFTSSRSGHIVDPLPSLQELDQRMRDKQEVSDTLAAGESSNFTNRTDMPAPSGLLPPIHVEGNKVGSRISVNSAKMLRPSQDAKQAINIQEKIQELKVMDKGRTWRHYAKRNTVWTSVRSNSPTSTSPGRSEVAERGCDVLCVELVRRLRDNQNWVEVVEVLEELPLALEKYWSIINENRVADLIRQVCVHVECPRTQVARAACSTLSAVVKNTNYTKKPDFYEAVSLLLTKTGSYSRPIRRAANVALDEIVSGVDVSHAIIALTLHGATHKSPLVRISVARLLVVGCALSGGGRLLLRQRPPHAALARRAALSALSRLLDDKHCDARKYAERLYLMLRPLQSFESYYLTDVDVELASKQMKKYDQMLLFGLVTKTEAR